MTLSLRNRQKTQPLDLRRLRRFITGLLRDQLKIHSYDLTVHIVGAREMTDLNQKFLGHSGSTDVITFDFQGELLPAAGRPALAGEIFISMDDAKVQAKQFGTSWQAELHRYIIHALLHLLGYDDRQPPARRKMKKEENRLLRLLHDNPPRTAAAG